MQRAAMKSTGENLGRKRPPLPNPIEAAITTWFHADVLPQKRQGCQLDELVSQAPKRWTVYEPMVLLPAGSFSAGTWKQLLPRLRDERDDRLWVRILAEISKRTGGALLTHLAVNEGIPAALRRGASEGHGSGGGALNDHLARDNVLRSPTGLRILLGDFGPASADENAPDFENAFWVSTRQNGVFQTWAPRWTMFSRGNIKEKARLLGFHDEGGMKGKSVLGDAWAVDLYAGIGYFTFSYAKLGMRVLCWELNPWSVEGLRRGAEGNGWSVRVVKHGRDLGLPMDEIVKGGERIIVFLEDNRQAARRIGELSRLNLLHVNCGLLPTSDASWKDAWGIASRGEGGEVWLHLHENVGVADIEKRRGEVEEFYLDLAREDADSNRTACVEHTELVKTFAPGVWHCVFDLHITRPSSIT